MTRRLCAVLVLSAAVLVTGAAPAQARNCGTFRATNEYGASGTFRATASGISCNKAKAALAAFFRGGGTADDFVRVRGWSCRLIRYYSPGRAGWRCRTRAGAVAIAYWTGEGV